MAALTIVGVLMRPMMIFVDGNVDVEHHDSSGSGNSTTDHAGHRDPDVEGATKASTDFVEDAAATATSASSRAALLDLSLMAKAYEN